MGIGARIAARWEALSGPRQLLVVYPTTVLVLLAIHVAFFHRITFGRSLAYALGEALFVTAFVMLATASERARKARGRVADDVPEVKESTPGPKL